MARIAPPVRLSAPAASITGGSFATRIGTASLSAPVPNVQGVAVRSVYAAGTVTLDGVAADFSGAGNVQLGAEYIFSGPTNVDAPTAELSAVQHSKRGFLLNDFLSANYSFSFTTPPLYGSFQYTDDGSYRYGSNPAYEELDIFTYQVTDAISTDSAGITIQDTNYTGFSVDQNIPDMTLTIDETRDMSQYVYNPLGLNLTTDVTGTNFTSYDPVTQELRGVTEGTDSNLQLTASDGQTLLNAPFTSPTWYTQWHNHDRVYANKISDGVFAGNPPYQYTFEPARIDRVTPADVGRNGYVPNPAGSGYAIEVTIVAGTNTGTGLSFFPRVSADGQTQDGANPTEMYLEYYFRLGSTWNNRTNTSGKFPGISGDFNDGAKGNWWIDQTAPGFDPADGFGWSSRAEFFDPCPSALETSFGSYNYHVGDKDFDSNPPDSWYSSQRDPGRGFRWDTMNCGQSNVMFINEWYKIKIYCKANTGSNFDGAVRGWLNDELVADHQEVWWTVNPAYQAIDRAWMNVYHGGGALAVPLVNLHCFIADVRIWVP